LEDHQLCLRLTRVCSLGSLMEPYAFYRVHADNSVIDGRVILEAHKQIRSEALCTFPTLVDNQSTAIQRVEIFAIKVMCLHHQWGVALKTIFRFWRSYELRHAWRVSLYLILLTIPPGAMRFLRKMYWRVVPAASH